MYKLARHFSKSKNAFDPLRQKLNIAGKDIEYYSMAKLGDPRLEELPYSVRILLENALRNNDGFVFTEDTVESILNWRKTSTEGVEIPFKPARVLLQDFTGVPAIVDLAAMRDAVKRLGVDPQKINPLCPVDLVVDHSVQVDVSRNADAVKQNERIEFERNKERFQFLKWGQNAFENFQIVPPGSGIVHQVNLEYLARVVFNRDGLAYPDTLVGTDSHTTMVNGLGVLGWGVGGIEAEAVMLGQHISMVIPEVVGFKLTGKLRPTVSATDLVLTVTQMLRKRGVVGKFVEFFGDGVFNLSVEDRATISNMAPEYGAYCGYFPIDAKTIDYMIRTGRSADKVELVHKYLSANNMLRDYSKSNEDGVKWSGELLELNLSDVEPCLSGPKRPHDKVPLSKMQQDFHHCMNSPNGFKGFGIEEANRSKTFKLNYKGQDYDIKHGDVVISAITSCTNTSNPGVMIAAGLLAKNAVQKGLNVKPYIKTSLSPGSGVVKKYLEASGLLPSLEQLGFFVTGFGCMTCIGNSGDLDQEIADVITKNDIIASAVLSGNRNFEGRVHPLTRSNYLASPPLCVAYAIAGTVDINFEKQPVGINKNGEPIYLKDIWPSNDEVQSWINKYITKEMFIENYSNIMNANENWNNLEVAQSKTYDWQEGSTYIHNPPFFSNFDKNLPQIKDIVKAYCLLNLGDSITTDHISPAGKIALKSPAAKYLKERDVQAKDFNSYGSRRGNDEIMARGTFANTRLINKMVKQVGPTTIHVPSGEEKAIYDVAAEYMANNQQTIILAGQEYGSGSSRDWAAKGPLLQGVKAVIAQSYERIHRSNLVGMGILPLEFLKGQSADSLGLTGMETFNIPLEGGNLRVRDIITVTTNTGKHFDVIARIDTDIEVEYFKHGGILSYVLRNLI